MPAPDATVVASLLRVPLEPPAVVVEVLARREDDDVVLDDLRWRGLDDRPVLAWLARPRGKAGRLPAVICLHGTGNDRDDEIADTRGEADDPKRANRRGWARELARRGFAALALTQRGLGPERPTIDTQVKELAVRGRRLMGAIVHEIRQAATWLAARDDVRSVSAAGFSYGGITAFWSWLVDPRIRACGSICGGVGSVDVLLRQGQPTYHGSYWWIPDLLLHGDHADLVTARAPAPFFAWAPTGDIGMPRDGVDRLRAAVTPIYARLGAAANLAVHQPAGEHAFTAEALERLADFLARHG